MSEIYTKRVKNIIQRLHPDKKNEIETLYSQSIGSKNGHFADEVIEKGFINEIDLITQISKETITQVIDISKCAVDPDVLDLIPEETASQNLILPISKLNDLLTVAVIDPYDIELFDDLRNKLKCHIRPVVTFKKVLSDAIKRSYNPDQSQLEEALHDTSMDDADSVDIEKTKAEADKEIDLTELERSDSPVIKVLNMLVKRSLKEHASDIHVEPFEKHTRVRMRIDGSLKEVLTLPKSIHNSLVTRIKVISDMNIAERRVPQDGKFQVKYESRQIDVRASVLPTIHGEKVVCRLLDSKNLEMRIDQLGFEPQSENLFREAIASSYGMILVTGPTGSGKSTTLYASLREVMSPTENIVTVEDPVEYQLFGINQVAVNAKKGLTFAGALRSILRQDPDIVMIGEIRDAETADIAVKAALTGHLVLSTLHTNDSASTITRLVDMGIDRFMVASSVICVSAQRLLRKLCEHCKKPMKELPPKDYLKKIGFKEEDYGGDIQLCEAVGCSSCSDGYKGRFAILEALAVDDSIKRMIVEGKSALDIKSYAVKDAGMLTLRRCGILNAIRGKTSIEEVLNMTMADDL